MGFVCLPIASSVRRSVPFVPALLSAATTFVSSTACRAERRRVGVGAVQTMPSTAVETVRIGRPPSLISMTRTPWW
ncbi:hypothetical protein CRM94_17530 [Burkholderia gladioli]|uniref:Uncharacterized protein n=1 Tax=Burkholderia gladioli TaxID=28095 RepID=A0A2A7RYI5_BURGA|nr:hypothetical protein CRM94_17530 [Burkholderia gladioli]